MAPKPSGKNNQTVFWMKGANLMPGKKIKMMEGVGCVSMTYAPDEFRGLFYYNIFIYIKGNPDYI